MRSLTTTFILFFILTSCQDKFENSSTFDVNSFSYSNIKLTAEILPLDSLTNPVRIYCYDSLLFLISNQTSKLVNIYNLKLRKKIGDVIIKGRGPEEMLMVNDLQFIRETDSFWAYDIIQKKMQEYSIKAIINNLDSPPIQSIRIKDVGCLNPMVISDQIIIANSGQTKPLGRFFFYNNKGETIDIKGNYPEYGKDIPLIAKSEVFSCKMGLKPDKSKIVLAYSMTDLIEIYNAEGKLLKRMHGPDCFSPLFEIRENQGGFQVVPFKEAKDAYVFPITTDEEFWVLYSGKSQSPGEYHMETLLSFNWDGRPLANYVLDVPIFGFDVDWDNRIIYGLSHKPKPSIYTFKF